MCTATRTRHQSVRKITAVTSQNNVNTKRRCGGEIGCGTAWGGGSGGRLSLYYYYSRTSLETNHKLLPNIQHQEFSLRKRMTRWRKTGKRTRREEGQEGGICLMQERASSLSQRRRAGGSGGTTVNKRRCRP